jgi:hypothetical protein
MIETDRFGVELKRGTASYFLYIDNKPLINIGKKKMIPFQENEVVVNNVFPTDLFYDYLPEDWDKTDPRLKLIDKIRVLNNVAK